MYSISDVVYCRHEPDHQGKRKGNKGPKTKSGIRLSSQRGFMDDLTISVESHFQARLILNVLEDVASLARMAVKPRKCRALIRGEV